MLEERRKIDGDLEVAHDTRLYGLVTGTVAVARDRKLIVHGMVGGDLLVGEASRVDIYGTVFGDVFGGDAELHIWKTATVRGTLHRGSKTTVEEGAKVHALTRAAPPSDRLPEVMELQSLRVLLVEDDDGTREELLSLLRASGASPIGASDGSEAYELFVRERPEAIVSDLWMPKCGGYDFIKRVRALSLEEGGLTPAIAMTASSDSQEKVLMAGFHAHLEKPFDATAFVELLRSFHEANQASSKGQAARWTVSRAPQGPILLTFTDHVRAIDMRDGVGAIALHLAEAPGTVLVDARHITGFDVSVGSVAERTVWKQRHRIERVVVVSSERSVRLVGAAACFILGVPYSVADRMP